MVTERATIPVEYGKLEGQYFTQWRIDLLQDLLQLVVYCYGNSPLVAVENIRIWYDAKEDFHRMTCEIGGNRVAVRFYKVFSASVSDVDVWVGCPRHEVGALAKCLRDLGPRLPGAD